MKKILITGGFGYLGAHFTEWFCRQDGWEVVVLTFPGEIRRSTANFRILQADIAEGEDLKRILDEPFDYCIHAASVNDSFVPGYPETALRVNAGGTRNLLDAMQGRGLKRLVYLSTIHVYGASNGRIDENAPPAPTNDYALTHWFAEQYVRMFQRRHDLPYVILRMTNVYGAPCHIDSSKWYLVLNDFARMAHDRKEIVIKSNGRARRDFIWVGDVCRIIERLLTAPEAVHQTLNVGAGRTLAIIELAELVKDVCQRRYGVPVAIRINEQDKTVYPETQVDCTRLRTIVGSEMHDQFKEEIGRIFDLLDAEPAG
ncbi:MAG: NAD(P)-dependent oxidoreductase [Thermoguttaceae bacterium]|jgi:UDP-glucose 4-epimerase